MRIAMILVTCLVGIGQHAMASEGRRADSVVLSGTWEFALGEGNEAAYAPEGQAALGWRPVTLPGRFVPWDGEAATRIKFVWARRTFDVSEAQAGRLAVLRWDRIVHGATAFINGQRVGCNEPTGPYQAILPQGVLKAGRNEVAEQIFLNVLSQENPSISAK